MPENNGMLSGLLGADPEAQEIARLQAQIAQLGGGGLLGGGAPAQQPGTFSKSQLPPQDIQQIYGLLAQYGDDPAQIGNQYVKAMQNQATIKGAYGQSPSNVREWEYYNQLSDDDKDRYLEMKRGLNFQNFAGQDVLTGLRGEDAGGAGTVVSDLPANARADEVMAAAGARGGQLATRFGTLETSRTGRYENYSTAQRLRNKIAENDLPTGQYTGLIYKLLPQADQEALDSLALQVARTKLRIEFGETRMTDADVDNMMKALFGSSRTEDFSVEQLDRLMREIQNQEDEYSRLSGYFSNISGAGQSEQPYTPGGAPGQLGAAQPGGGGGLLGPGAEEAAAEQNAAYDNASAEDLLAEQERRRQQRAQ